MQTGPRRLRNGKQRQREYNRSQRTKAAILHAATREFAMHGIAGARVDRIAKAAGVNNHALYYHFGNKAALFRVVLENGYESFRADRQPRALPDMDPEKGIVRIVSEIFDFVQRTPEHRAIAIEVNRRRGANLDRRGRTRIRTVVAPLLRDIEFLVQQGKASRRFRLDIDPEHLYLTIFALCSFYFTNAYTVSAVVGRDLLAPAAIRSRREEICRFVLAGLRR